MIVDIQSVLLLKTVQNGGWKLGLRLMQNESHNLQYDEITEYRPWEQRPSWNSLIHS